jgi:HAD superfamily hydrolase (TIGR01549 family)
MAIRAIFLDFGGTLVRSFQDPFPVWTEVLLRHEVHLSRSRFASAEAAAWALWSPRFYDLAGARPSLWDRMHGEILHTLDLVDAREEILDELREEFASTRWHPPFPETTSVLRTLAERDLTLHVVSNNTDALPALIRKFAWSRYVTTITYSQEAGAEKPDGRIFDLALRRAGVQAEGVVHVGDSLVADVDGARRSGLRAVWVNRSGLPIPPGVESVPNLEGLLARIETSSPTSGSRNPRSGPSGAGPERIE